MSSKPSLIIISGPTCVGKTSVAITLAEPLGGEIVSVDAMQIYRHMDIGTAKPTKEQRARVRHHLIDVADPDESFSAAIFKQRADEIIQDLHEKARPIFVVGGTGLYIKALTHGLFEEKEQDNSVKERLRKEAETLGLEALYQRLQEVDPEAATRIHANDTYRIIRALEVHEATGRPVSEHHKAHGFQDTSYRTLKIGLTLDRDVLYDRINTRVDMMLASGLLEEVKQLLDHGYPSTLKSMQSIGYRHMADYLEQRATWDECVRVFKRDTRRYAKRQLTWFRADPEIEWMEPGQIDVMRQKIDAFLAEQALDP